MVDAIFAERRLTELYDPLDPDRGDLDVYAAMAAELGARSVLDIGCGTGTFACLLARGGLTVTAVTRRKRRSRSPGPSQGPIGCGGCTATPPTCPRCGWTW